MQSERTIELVKWQERLARTRGALPKIRGSPYPNRVGPLFQPKPPKAPRHIPHLPNEIIHLIIENLDNFMDRAPLATLCLVSKDFLLPSRKALYASISIYEDDPLNEPKDYSALLCSSLSLRPHLAALVRRIKIFDPNRHNSPKYWVPSRQRTKYFPIPPDLPPTLTHIRLNTILIDDITTFLESGTCPLLSSAKFELQSKPNPWSLIAMARAAKEGGLRVVEKEPRWDGNYDLDQRSVTELGMPPHIMLYLVKWQGRPPRTRGALPKIRGSPYPSRVTPLFLPEKPRHIPRLPNEIIHLIIENFDNLYDLATLATLCRVSKDFLLPSRKALYATVSIFGHFEPSEESCKILCDSLTLHPHLAALVRRIEMRPGPDTSGPAPPHTICIPNYSYLKKLAPIYLRVYAHDGHRHHKAYLAIPPNLPPTLTHLRLDVPGIDDIVKFLNSATCPLLVIAEFGLPSEPNPWTRIEVARAAKQRGLRVIEEEPMWDDDYEEDEGVDRIETRQMVLEEFWK
ncbi:hypothetical protein RQP46_011103 [Phenoliferia psychrophenolica]